jgi:hypothetical protein
MILGIVIGVVLAHLVISGICMVALSGRISEMERQQEIASRLEKKAS